MTDTQFTDAHQPPPERTSTYWPATTAEQYPAIEVAGVMAFLYVKDGMVRVSVDLDTADEHLQHGPEGLVPLHITVQGSDIYYTEPRGD